MIDAGTLHLDQCGPQAGLPPFWRLGVLTANAQPVIWPMDYRRGLLLQAGPKAAAHTDRLLENCLLQVLLQSPSSGCRITVCDAGLSARFPALDELQRQTGDQAVRRISDRRQITAHVAAQLDKARNRRVQLARERLPDWISCLAARRVTEPVEFLVLPGLWGDFELLDNLRELFRSGGALGIIPIVVLGCPPVRYQDNAQQAEAEAVLEDIRQAALQLLVDKDGGLDVRDPALGLLADLYRFFAPVVDSPEEEARQRATSRIVAALKQTPPMAVGGEEGVVIPVGSLRGSPFSLSLGGAAHVHHALVAGITRSGKTSLLQLLATRLCQAYPPSQVRLFLLDDKDGFSFSLFGDLPHVEWLHQGPRGSGALQPVLAVFAAEADKRTRLLREAGPGISSLEAYNRFAPMPLPRWLLLVDDIDAALMAAEDGVRLREDLRMLLRSGASLGMHAVFSAQSCTDSLLDAACRAQMRLKIALRMGNSAESEALFGRLNEAALAMPPFQALVNTSDGDPEGNLRVELDHLPEIPDLARALDALRERYPLKPAAVEAWS